MWIFFTIVFLVVVGFIIYFYIKHKVGLFTKKYFGTTSLKEAIDKSELIEENTPKSISSMEPVLKSKIESDFPDLNLNEIKRLSESVILDIFDILNKKEKTEKYNEKVNIWINTKLGKFTKDVHFDSIKIHKTTVRNYEKRSGVATLKIASSLEYYCSENGNRHKKQDRFILEYIYIIDSDKYKGKVVGLNCPNCGANIKSLGNKTCVYCGTGVKDIVKRTWSINNIDEY